LSELFFILGNFLAIYISFAVAELTMCGRELWRHTLTLLSLFPVIVLIVTLILGTAGALTSGNCVLFLILIALPLFKLHKKNSSHLFQKKEFKLIEPLPPQTPFPKNFNYSDTNSFNLKFFGLTFFSKKCEPHRQKVSSLNLNSSLHENRKNRAITLALSFLAGLWVLFIIKTCFSGTSFTGDDVGYHAIAPAQWILDKRLSLAPLSYQAYYPFNSELLSLWFMLPFKTDALVGLAGFYWGFLALAAGITLNLSEGLAASVLCGVLILVSPVVINIASTFSATDLAGAGMLLAAVALAPREKNRYIDVFYCALFSGFAVGCKVYYLPAGGILLFSILSKNDNKRLPNALIFITSFLITGGYWYIRNICLTGNPLFPAKIGPFDGPFGLYEQYSTKLISFLWTANPEQWKFLIKNYLNWPTSLGLLSIAGYIFSIKKMIKKGLSKQYYSLDFMLPLIGLTLLITYPMMPFSGTVNSPHRKLLTFRRYLIAPFSIGLFMLSPMLKGRLSCLFFSICVAFAMYNSLNVYSSAVVLLGGIAFFIIFEKYGCVKRMRKLKPLTLSRRLLLPRPLYVILFAALIVMATWAPYKHKLNSIQLYHNCFSHKYPIGAVWRELEKLPDGAKITGFGTGGFSRYYPLFGRRLQFTPYFPWRKPMHEYWQSKGTLWDTWGRGRKSYERRILRMQAGNNNDLMRKLVDAGVDYVVLTKWWNRYGSFPVNKTILSSFKNAKILYSDRHSIIWKIRF